MVLFHGAQCKKKKKCKINVIIKILPKSKKNQQQCLFPERMSHLLSSASAQRYEDRKKRQTFRILGHAHNNI